MTNTRRTLVKDDFWIDLEYIPYFFIEYLV